MYRGSLILSKAGGLNGRTLFNLWKASVPHWVWIGSPAWIGGLILALEGSSPRWGPLALFMAATLTIQCIAEFSNSYTDREEDRLYGPTNPLVTGELDATTARVFLVFQNVLAATLLVILLAVTLNWALVAVMVVGWYFGAAYSVRPFRLKETVLAPFSHAIAFALLPVAAWLAVERPLTEANGLILGFAAVLFLHSFGLGITLKFRKTLLAYDSGLIKEETDPDLLNLRTVGFRLRFKSAMRLEELTSLLAFALVPVFWHLGVFGAPMSIALLALPFPLTALGLLLRLRDPVANGSKYKVLMTLSWIMIVVVLLGIAVASQFGWAIAVAACFIFTAGFPLLVRIVHPWGCKSLNGRY